MMSESLPPSTQAALRGLPSVNALLKEPALQAALGARGVSPVTEAVRSVLEETRREIRDGESQLPTPPDAELAERCLARLGAEAKPRLRPVINATGILLHTGLGRAPLAEEAIEAAAAVSRGYCNVEVDLESGERSQRSHAVAKMLGGLTGAEAALVVNNNAGATGLAVAALAAGREVVVSHGELIEIGGGYRMPEVVTAYGAELRAVGTTNKTRVADYENAIDEKTGALLVVHPSNYEVSGFTQRPALEDLAKVAAAHDVPLVHDVGSGALIDFAPFGCEGEPVVGSSVLAGADLVLFSGDKLLGGPQCGIAVGKRRLVEKMLRHPLCRALRVDKVTLAALQATLALYADPETAKQRVPLLRMLNAPLGELRRRAEGLACELRRSLSGWDVTAICDEAYVGGGALPHRSLASWSVALKPSDESSEDAFAQRLRAGSPPVVGRLSQGRLVLGLHAVHPEEDSLLLSSVVSAWRSLES
ncbi:L-seryl-tRNA(Sec) selenium transferase [Planctomycetes bacterium MalM25]|nr:L-seryl-tRNA(Sec) selenium transferase [Planctomycetes bacterium MalM25]